MGGVPIALDTVNCHYPPALPGVPALSSRTTHDAPFLVRLFKWWDSATRRQIFIGHVILPESGFLSYVSGHHILPFSNEKAVTVWRPLNSSVMLLLLWGARQSYPCWRCYASINMARAYISFLASVSPDSSNLISFDEAEDQTAHTLETFERICLLSLVWAKARHWRHCLYTCEIGGSEETGSWGLSHAETRRGFGGDGGGAGRSS